MSKEPQELSSVNQISSCISELDDLITRLGKITKSEFQQLLFNILRLSEKLAIARKKSDPKANVDEFTECLNERNDQVN